MDASMKILRRIGIGAFLAAIWLPFLQMELGLFTEFDNMENRELAPVPELSAARWEQLPGEYDLYLSDRFGLRPNLIRWNSISRLKLLGVSPVKSVIAGEDSWLFYCSEALEDGNSINDYMGTLPLSRSELAGVQQRLERNRKEFTRNGMVYLVVIVPNKNTIYDEYLPQEIREHKGTPRLDQFMAHMRANSDVEILDLREPLLQAKKDHPLYWKTDSHWNTYGAYIGYREIIRRLSRTRPELVPAAVAEGSVTVRASLPGGDLAQMLFMQDLLPEAHNTAFDLATPTPKPPMNTLLFRHDSFGDNLYPFLRLHFKRILNIAPFAPFRFDAIGREHPEVVVHVFAERYILQALHDDFFHGGEKKKGS